MSWFGRVDSRAVAATAMNLDLAGLYDTIITGVIGSNVWYQR